MYYIKTHHKIIVEMSYSKDLRKRAIDLVIEEKYEKCKQII